MGAAGARLETAIHDTISDAAARFLAGATTAAVCASSPDGRLWASVWFGASGFLVAEPGGQAVTVRRAPLAVSAGDPVRQYLRIPDRVGMLAIDFATRRRLRINGTVLASDDDELIVSVEEVFPNCSMYIQRRQSVPVGRDSRPSATVCGDRLDATHRASIGRADTAFVASTHPRRGLDVSHRGGSPGFIVVEDDRTLRVPDYPGNNMFATLGNFEVSPRAGLVIVDFDGRRLLSLTGVASVAYDTSDARGTGGTRRSWRLAVESWIELGIDCGIQWALLDRSPFNPPLPGEEPS